MTYLHLPSFLFCKSATLYDCIMLHFEVKHRLSIQWIAVSFHVCLGVKSNSIGTMQSVIQSLQFTRCERSNKVISDSVYFPVNHAQLWVSEIKKDQVARLQLIQGGCLFQNIDNLVDWQCIVFWGSRERRKDERWDHSILYRPTCPNSRSSRT